MSILKRVVAGSVLAAGLAGAAALAGPGRAGAAPVVAAAPAPTVDPCAGAAWPYLPDTCRAPADQRPLRKVRLVGTAPASR